MSDNILKVFPAEPTFLPSQEAQDRAERLFFLLFPDADDISVDVSKEIIFVDQGENFERVLCPACGAALEIDWWNDAVNEAAKDGFTMLEIELTCCNLRTSLNNLCYDWPAGFARFVIQARNPGLIDIKEQSMRQLESILGCKLRIVKARY